MSRPAHWVPTGGDDRGVPRCGQPMVPSRPADPGGPLCPHCLVIFLPGLVESGPPRFARPRPGPQTRPAAGVSLSPVRSRRPAGATTEQVADPAVTTRRCAPGQDPVRLLDAPPRSGLPAGHHDDEDG